MEYLGDTPEKRDKMQTAWKAAWYILDRFGFRPDLAVAKETPSIYPPDPEAEYERLYRRGEIEIVVEPEPWEPWTGGYIKLREEVAKFDPILDENEDGITRIREKCKESTNRQGTPEPVESETEEPPKG